MNRAGKAHVWNRAVKSLVYRSERISAGPEVGMSTADQRPVSERPPPANKLSDAEKDCILKICHKSEYASLPPGQIVPRLADKGVYIASESSFYRVLHQADEQHHRGRSQKPNKRVIAKIRNHWSCQGREAFILTLDSSDGGGYRVASCSK